MRLHTPVPDIPVNVRRMRRRKQEHRPHENAEAQQIEEIPAALLCGQPVPVSQKQPREDGVWEALRKSTVYSRIVSDAKIENRGRDRRGKQHRRRDHEAWQRPRNPHAAASSSSGAAPAPCRARRSLKSESRTMDCKSANECRAGAGSRPCAKGRPSSSSPISTRTLFAIVDIVPFGQDMDRKADFLRAGERLRKDGIGAPADGLKKAAMHRFARQEIISAVGRRSEHGAVSGLLQHTDRLHERRNRQSRAVRIQDTSCAVTGCELEPQRLHKTRAKIGAPNLMQSNGRWHMRAKESLAARRPVCNRARNTRLGGGLDQIARRYLSKRRC